LKCHDFVGITGLTVNCFHLVTCQIRASLSSSVSNNNNKSGASAPPHGFLFLISDNVVALYILGIVMVLVIPRNAGWWHIDTIREPKKLVPLPSMPSRPTISKPPFDRATWRQCA
jgi:hypothetical protein